MLETQDREFSPDGVAVDAWPDWRISSENASELARYVDVIHTRNWVPVDCRGPWRGSAEGQTRAARLYEAIRGHRIGYADEQWNPARRDLKGRAYQRIRGPEQTMLGPATCLELALVYAGMAASAGIRTFVGLRMSQEPHALVILDISAPLAGLASTDGLAHPPWFTERRDDPGVWDTAGEVAPGAALVRLAESGGWLVVDIVQAARSGGKDGAPFGQASGRMAAEESSKCAGEQQWTLVDVDRVLSRDDRRPYRPPTVAPPIHAYLPALPSYTAYPSRQRMLTSLTDVLDERRASIVVLQAPQGFGKSMLAHRLALGADNGCGWFLDATDPKALTASLARAERREDQTDETAADGEKPDPGSARAFASAALERLRDARLPWVVVLDNCDVPPETAGLLELMPVPHQPGQNVIITTTHHGWVDAATRYGWRLERLSPLEGRDLDDLPAGVQTAVAGRPLIARALSALENHGAVLPDQTDLGGPELVWKLARELPDQDPEVVAAARALAWCPPEPWDLASVIEAAGGHEPAVADVLLHLRLVTPSDSGSGIAIGMHRLIARAIRTQTWRDAPEVASDVVAQLMTSEAGQRFFIDAADETALVRLERGDGASEPGQPDEPGEAARAAQTLTDVSRRGLIWYGLGHIRERRGPVSASLAPFRRAAKSLDPAEYPFQTAESLVGQARVIYQTESSTPEQLETARGIAEDARRLLEPLTEVEARQLREQGNALAWLIRRRLAAREQDLATRSARLIDVRDHLWQSYEERRRIARPDHHASPRSAPVAEDGLGAERAYFNLAGVYVELAKTHHQLARKADGDERQILLALTAEDLAGAAAIYQNVRVLREVRYHGRPHPHLAACVNGEAIVAYYHATLLDDTARLPDALGLASTAMEQRHKIASGLIGPTASVRRDNDVKKSVDLMLKAAVAVIIGRGENVDAGIAAALEVFEKAVAETRDALPYEDPAPAGNLTVTPRPGATDTDNSPDPDSAVRAEPPRRRQLRGECPDNVRIGKPFSLLARVVLSEGGAQLKSFAVPPDGLDVLIVVHAPGLTVRGDHMATLRVPAGEDSEPVRFELRADRPGPSRVLVTAWWGGNYLGELTLEVTARHETPVSHNRDRSADLSTETVDHAVSLVVRYEPRDNRYRFWFHDADNPREEPYLLSYELGPRLENLVEDLGKVAGGESGYSPPEARDYLIDAGTRLWRELLPERLRQQLWERRGQISQLTILADNDTVPWELLYPNDPGRTPGGFLAEQFPMTRDVFERPPPPATLNLRPSRFVRPDGSPPAAEREIDFLRELFETTPPDDVIAEFGPLRELINRGDFGLLHFACHNNFCLDRGSSIMFGRRSFTTTNLETAKAGLTLRSAAPLVFINACRSAGLAATYNQLDGWAEAFLQAGAAAFVGSQWAVGDGPALKFAEFFYQRLMAGETLGQATLSTRRAASKRKGDPTWLAYAVYGNPRARMAQRAPSPQVQG